MSLTPSGRSRSASLAVNWLSTNPESATVLATARQLLAIEQNLTRQLPSAFASACRAARLDQHCLTLAVPSAGFAAKLRQMAPRLIADLNAAGWNITELAVKVQAGNPVSVTQKRVRDIEPLGQTSLAAFRKLLETTPPGPLADAINRLLKHHGG